VRFSGHETFPVRDGWLHKGLALLLGAPEEFHSKHAADYLGVGKNMARSIKHWLQATKLAMPDPSRRGHLNVTDFGHCVAEQDIYFAEPGTWWFLHINLLGEPVYADTWFWFFNSFGLQRFERATVVENLRRFLQAQARRMPSHTTLQRDVACLLASYARSIPGERLDPEESRDCPFQELDLMSHFQTSGYYQAHQGPRSIEPEVLGYCLSAAFADGQEGGARRDVRVSEAARVAGGPGKAFALSPEGVLDSALQAEEHSSGEIEVAGHAGERVIRFMPRTPVQWAQRYYDRAHHMGEQHAA